SILHSAQRIVSEDARQILLLVPLQYEPGRRHFGSLERVCGDNGGVGERDRRWRQHNLERLQFARRERERLLDDAISDQGSPQRVSARGDTADSEDRKSVV